MQVSKKRSLALSIAVTNVFGVGVRADDTEFAVRLNEARQAVLSGAGKDYYDGPFSKAFRAQRGKRIKQLSRCWDGRDSEDSFDILLKLSADGRVETAITNSELRIAACYLKDAQKDKFPSPPAAGFWVEVPIWFGRSRAVEVPLRAPTRPTHLLITSLSSETASVRLAAAAELVGATDLRVEAVAALEPLLNDSDRAVRYAAAWATGHLYSASGTKHEGRLYQTPPKVIFGPKPRYPKDAFAAKIEGTALIAVLIGEQGEVARAELRRSIPALDAAALASVREWRFEPARANGVPRACVAHIPVAFRIY